MANIDSAQPAFLTSAEYEAVFDRLMVEAESINEHVRHVHIKIERLKAKTATIQNETRTALENIDVAQSVWHREWKQRHDRDMAAREREGMILRAENQRLRADLGLPPYDGNSLF